ncbi:type IV secretion system DNA-binding domain-containing protein [Undibacterium jejuense]|uniref:Type IV secretion system DNA-binding domain-containing protein n=1 Tax=Undibacterium jejuense TaxID=1344949 RepID=A0A923HGY3_9BURK|nr:type IV secretion system DNA-binding domain-containing protein [Undibacterium jejuense]MBC3864322.1 type IV secretion system DNA-binding domain-containing protein [Undibacterium jejuense]
MAINKKSTSDNFTRGSDTIWHQVQMLFAGVRRLAIICISITMLSFSIYVMLITNSMQRQILKTYYEASIIKSLGMHRNVTIDLPDGKRTFEASHAKEILEGGAGKFKILLLLGVLLSMGIGVVSVIKLTKYQIKRGLFEAEDKFIEGQKLVESEELSNLTREKSKGGFEIGSVPIPDALLQRNFAFIGNPGTGKSRAIFRFLDSARPNMKAVVYDRTGDYVERYYNPARGDIILNPFDARCANWSIFSDLKEELDYSTMSNYFIQEKKGEAHPEFKEGARILFEDILKFIQIEPGFEKSMAELTRVINTMTLERIFELARKYQLPSAGALNPENVKTSEGVRFSLITQPAIRFFKYFNETSTNFSISDFVKSDDKAWLFILSHPTQHVAIKPFAAAWLEIAMLAAMSQRPINYNRIIFAIDELASLPKLKAVETGLTEARKFGVSILLGFQTDAQIDEVWGAELRRVLLANCQTKAIFRSEDGETAARLADTLGKKAIDEASEGAHFGVESDRDSSQLQRKRTEIHLAMASVIQTLPDRTAFLKIAGNYPLAKVVIPNTPDVKVAEAYQNKQMPDLLATLRESANSATECNEVSEMPTEENQTISMKYDL